MASGVVIDSFWFVPLAPRIESAAVLSTAYSCGTTNGCSGTFDVAVAAAETDISGRPLKTIAARRLGTATVRSWCAGEPTLACGRVTPVRIGPRSAAVAAVRE